MQPDTVTPGGPQGLNRYSYVSNSPVNFNDPTGHYACGDGEEHDCDEKKGDLKIIGGPKCGGPGQKKCDGGGGGKPRLSPKRSVTASIPCGLCLPQEDATLISFSYAASLDDEYRAWGIDIVISNDEVGVFYIDSAGPGLGHIPKQQTDKTYMSPQVSASLYLGKMWGKSLRESVTNYQGPALAIGGSGGASGEYFESVNPKTGVPNGDVRGVAAGVGLGPTEIHAIYTDAEFLFGFGF